jgi:hypothetical protein
MANGVLEEIRQGSRQEVSLALDVAVVARDDMRRAPLRVARCDDRDRERSSPSRAACCCYSRSR